jgi:hypothetical protein
VEIAGLESRCDDALPIATSIPIVSPRAAAEALDQMQHELERDTASSF